MISLVGVMLYKILCLNLFQPSCKQLVRIILCDAKVILLERTLGMCLLENAHTPRHWHCKISFPAPLRNYHQPHDWKTSQWIPTRSRIWHRIWRGFDVWSIYLSQPISFFRTRGQGLAYFKKKHQMKSRNWLLVHHWNSQAQNELLLLQGFTSV